MWIIGTAIVTRVHSAITTTTQNKQLEMGSGGDIIFVGNHTGLIYTKSDDFFEIFSAPELDKVSSISLLVRKNFGIRENLREAPEKKN